MTEIEHIRKRKNIKQIESIVDLSYSLSIEEVIDLMQSFAADEQVKKLEEEINKLDNKLQNNEYDSVFNRDCDIDDLRCLKRTIEIFNELKKQ